MIYTKLKIKLYMQKIIIDFSQVKSFEDFHCVFKEKLWFPSFYGMNMDAWNDCMSSLDYPEHWMSTVHINKWETLIIEWKNIKPLKKGYPDIYDALIECSAFVNWRRTNEWWNPLISLSFYW